MSLSLSSCTIIVTKDDEFRVQEADEGPQGGFNCVPVLRMTNWEANNRTQNRFFDVTFCVFLYSG